MVTIAAGKQVTVTEVIEMGTTLTVRVVAPNLVVSCNDVAVMVAVPADAGVKTPFDVIVPFVDDHVIPLLYTPVPCTDAAQTEV